MAQGYLALVLHAHLPFVHHPEYDDCLEERWLFEALIESYIPLLLRLRQLEEEGIPFKLTLSLSPTLAAMLANPFLQSRFIRRIETLLAFSEKETHRNAGNTPCRDLAQFYRSRLQQILHFYQSCDRNILKPLISLQRGGHIEFIATAATHGYLPLLGVNKSAVRTQVNLGVQACLGLNSMEPRGFWLPECGYAEGMDTLLRKEGIAFTILETHGVTRADPRPSAGVYEPIISPTGMVFFGRDPLSSRQVWSASEGYPGDGEYREFYRDIAYDLDESYLAPLLHPPGIRTDTGFKYYRITGKHISNKDFYHPDRARLKAKTHAQHFLSQKTAQIRDLSQSMTGKPIVVAPFDAELFGHWWFEGPDWLYYLLKHMQNHHDIEPVTLSEYLDRHPPSVIAEPCESSWGGRGFHETWLNESTDWIYPILHESAISLDEAICRPSPKNGLVRRACNQALRELLLAQASDWAFMITHGTTDHYAGGRVKKHIADMYSLLDDINSGTIDELRLASIECRDSIFPNLDHTLFCDEETFA